jgi:hypothetical protein
MAHLMNWIMDELKDERIKDELLGCFQLDVRTETDLFSPQKQEFCVILLGTRDQSTLTESCRDYFCDAAIEGGY